MGGLFPVRFYKRCVILLIALFGIFLVLFTAQSGIPSVYAAQATDTPTPALPILTPKLGRVPITAQNTAQISQLMQIGNGGATGVCWSPEGGTLGVASSIGLWLYDAHDWSKAPSRLGTPANLSGCSWSPHSRYMTMTNAQQSSAIPWSVAIWKVADGSVFKSFNDVNSMAWSPDGRYFATTDVDKHVRLWDGVNGQLLIRLATQGIAWSPDGRFVAFIDSSAVLRVWTGATNSIVFADSSGWNNTVWSPDSHWLAVSNSGGAVGLAAVAPQKLAIAPIVPLSQTGWNGLSWPPDSTQFATAGRDSTLVIWNAADGQKAQTFTFDKPVMTVAWSPAGQTIAIEVYSPAAEPFFSSPTYLELINASTGQDLFDTSPANSETIWSISWSPAGHYLIARDARIGEGGESDEIELFSPLNRSNEPIWNREMQNPIDWSPDDMQIAAVTKNYFLPPHCCNNSAWVTVEALTSRPFAPDFSLVLGNVSGTSPYVAWSPNGQYLAWESTYWDLTNGIINSDPACGCDSGFIWGTDSDLVAVRRYVPMAGVSINAFSEFGTNNKGLSLDPSSVGIAGLLDYLPQDLALSPDITYLAFDSGNDIYIWQIDQGTLFQTLHGHTAQVNTEAFSPDGQYLASGSADTTIRIWQVSSGQSLQILNGHTAAVNRVVWSPDGTRLASASDDQTVRIWDTASGALLLTLKGHSDSVVSVQWSPNGKLVASASKDGTIKVWGAVQGTLLTTLSGHVGAINDLSWSPDGKTLASAGADATIRLWGIR
ncbi:MAG: WD40 repeat domain-containing protein [Aggregatilineales bacterium]